MIYNLVTFESTKNLKPISLPKTFTHEFTYLKVVEISMSEAQSITPSHTHTKKKKRKKTKQNSSSKQKPTKK